MAQMRRAIRRRLIRLWSRTMSQVHVRIYRTTGGRIGSRRFKTRILLLRTTGHRSGRSHTVPLAFASLGDQIILAAGNVAFGRVPHWLQNLQAEPRAQVTVGRDNLVMHARVVGAEEHDELWPRAVEGIRGIDRVARFCSEPIPLIVLSPLS